MEQHQYDTYSLSFTKFLTEFLTFLSLADARQNAEICLYTVFHKIGTPLFSFYTLSKCCSILIKIISLCLLWSFLTATMFLRSELQDLWTLQDQNHKLWECIVDEWDKLDQCIINQVVGEWRKRLQAFVVIGGGQCEHKTFSLLTFCRVLFLKGRLAGW